MKTDFAVGDVVKLASDGPDMTIKSYHSTSAQFVCQWFAGKKLEQGGFCAAQLILVKKRDAS